MTRVAFLCCHLSGTGHLIRTLALARASAAAGARVLLISGGRPLRHVALGGVEFLQLPPVHVPDFDFSTLRRPDGIPADASYMATRRTKLEQTLAGLRPNALVTETFPFGRRTLAAEFEAAISACPQAAIVASVRDIPEPPKKPAKLAEAIERLRRLYDAVLVHGDADFLPLHATWTLPDDLGAVIHHTGYVATDPPAATEPPGDTVLVAVGGGVLGRRLLEIAARAAALSARPWHLLTGGADAAVLAHDLTARLGRSNLTIEPARADYRSLLALAACSVSLAGYNTVLDIAASTTPAILAPFDEHDEQEQGLRAARLAACPGFTVLRVDDLTPENLAAAAETAAAGPRRAPLALARDGAARAARLILELAK
jgi:predicted glycosyltransferase